MSYNPKRYSKQILAVVAAVIVTALFNTNVNAQQKRSYMRIAHIKVKPEKLEAYKTALTEGIKAAVKKEAGVLSLRAMYDKQNPSHITVFEIYADMAAYQSHIQTVHFKKYKETVAGMVLSLELIDVDPIAFEDKKGK
jgi:quinol monooxygenase YgiN